MRKNRDNVWVFGGYATGLVMNDMYELSMDSLKWSEVEVFGAKPHPRYVVLE